MRSFFLDASVLVKRYLTEPGSDWIQSLLNPANGYLISIAEITQVEVAAALAARHRAPKGISRAVRDRAVDLLALHCQQDYHLLSLTPETLDRAVALTQEHRLRGYDAVQLATALVANDVFIAAGLPALTFVAADADLLAAAGRAGLTAVDPALNA